MSTSRFGSGWSAPTVALWVVLVVVIVTVASLNIAVHVGHQWAGVTQPLDSNPFGLFFDVMRGRVAWPPESTTVMIITFVVLAVLAILLALLIAGRGRRGGGRNRVDHATKHLGRGAAIRGLSLANAREVAKRFGVEDSPGLPIGREVATGEWLYGTWEDMQIDIWGPRTGKTTARAIPAVLAAPGAAVVTSNKRDILDATRDIRESRTNEKLRAAGNWGHHQAVWIFDPQNIAQQDTQKWWWNPLSHVIDEQRAASLADHFATASRGDGQSGKDGYFDTMAREVLAGFLLAAALDRRDITDVFVWLTKPDAVDPEDILRDKKHDYELIAELLASVREAPEQQRDGVYGTAQQMVACLTNKGLRRWITKPDSPLVKEFSPREFLESHGTLYLLSKEGMGNAGPIVTALTVAVVDTAEELAVQSPGGRLPVPLVGVLDEAANVCRWRNLPDMYSHYGSRGIVLMTILQSWSQGSAVWGQEGMKKLWSASNVRVYGGGASEAAFLEDLSKQVGDFDRDAMTVTRAQGKRTVAHTTKRERVLEVSDLASLPRGRALVIGSGSAPALVATQPWMEGPDAAAIRRSIDAHDPVAQLRLRQRDEGRAKEQEQRQHDSDLVKDVMGGNR